MQTEEHKSSRSCASTKSAGTADRRTHASSAELTAPGREAGNYQQIAMKQRVFFFFNFFFTRG